MNQVKRWLALVLGYLAFWPVVTIIVDISALKDGGAWIFMLLMWGSMALFMLLLLPINIEALEGRKRIFASFLPYLCVGLGGGPWIWFWFVYPFPWVIVVAHIAYAIIVQMVLFGSRFHRREVASAKLSS
jgi:hypothetical protein